MSTCSDAMQGRVVHLAFRSFAAQSLGLGAIFAASVGSLSTPACAWQYEIDEPGLQAAGRIAIDSMDDVIALGRGPSVPGCSSAGGYCDVLRIVKLSGETGEEIWRLDLEPPRTARDFFYASVVVDDADNPIVSGGWSGKVALPGVRKLDGATGAILWEGFGVGTDEPVVLDPKQETAALPGGAGVARLSLATGKWLWFTPLTGPAMLGGALRTAAFDDAGDVFAAGYLREKPRGGQGDATLLVAKFDGETGAEVWRQALDATPPPNPRASFDLAGFVAVDAANDVFAAGLFGDNQLRLPILIKFSGATGEELWRRTPAFQVPATDARGHLFGGGLNGSSFTLVEHSPESGDQIARTDFAISNPPPDSFGYGWGLGAPGDVIVWGSTGQPKPADCIGSRQDFTVVKLSASTGRDVWKTMIPSCGTYGAGAARAIVDSAGNVVASGEINANFAVVKLNGSDGSDYTPPVPVEIDIRPGNAIDPVNPKSAGVIAVAVLGAADFDVAEIDAETLGFGPDAVAPVHVLPGKPKDVNGDGLADLVCHFRTAETGIAPGDETACLTGKLADGRSIIGCDSIRSVPPTRPQPRAGVRARTR